ncbi:SHOCT domain-containing protein [Halobacteria archaeon HArc-gm2]|nr:SHOCT domain-containing protein [Halobacteria archaeon HArc-gm2]
MTQEGERLVTGEFLGLFLVFGADIILVVVPLAIAGIVSGAVAVAVTALILGVYGGWLGLRWWRLRDSAEPTQPNPLETLKDRYAAGEISDEEFERRLDRLIDTEREERATVDERSKERSNG